MTNFLAKNASDEGFLRALNDFLEPFELKQYSDGAIPYPVIHIVGLPRSGTTLLMQALVTAFELGYPSNLVAAFWRAPVTGVRLARKILRNHPESNFRSEFGRTGQVWEPHEFGYFWTHHLKYEDLQVPAQGHEAAIDWVALQKCLASIAAAFDKPVVFKSFMLAWFAASCVARMPGTLFVRTRRNLAECAVSILRMRERIFGDRAQWYSLRPVEYPWLAGQPYWIQAAGQAYFLEQHLDSVFGELPDENKLQVDLEDLQARPRAVAARVADKLAALGFRPRSRLQLPVQFEPSFDASRDPDFTKVCSALEQLFDKRLGP